MRSPFRVATAFVHGPLRHGAGQIVMSVTAGVCVVLVTQALIPDHRVPATTDVQQQSTETVRPRDDRLPKAAIAAPVAAIDATETGSVLRTQTERAETHVAKLPAVEPHADYQGPAPDGGPQPYTPPMADSGGAPPPAIAESDYAIAPTAADDTLRPPADIDAPGQPMILSGAVQPRAFGADAEFDVGPPAPRGAPILALPFNAVERGVFALGDVIASIGKPDRRY